jgi:hypothetical protein
VRRLNGSSEHLPIMADAERGLGRPERAIALSQEPEAATLDPEGQIELAIVVSGARLDLGQPEAAVAALSGPLVKGARGLVAARVAQARAAALEAAGRPDEAEVELAAYSQDVLDEAAGNTPEHEDVVVYDLTEDEDDETADGSGLTGDVDSDDEAPDERSDAADGGPRTTHDGAVSDVEGAASDSAASDEEAR